MDSDNFGVYVTAVMGGVMYLIRWWLSKIKPDLPDAGVKGILIAFGTVVAAIGAHYLSPTTSAEQIVLMIGAAFGGQSAVTTGTDTIKLTSIRPAATTPVANQTPQP